MLEFDLLFNFGQDQEALMKIQQCWYLNPWFCNKKISNWRGFFGVGRVYKSWLAAHTQVPHQRVPLLLQGMCGCVWELPQAYGHLKQNGWRESRVHSRVTKLNIVSQCHSLKGADTARKQGLLKYIINLPGWDKALRPKHFKDSG